MPANVADLVREAAATSPDKPALIEGDTTVTWAELDARVSALAAGLGDEAGRRVGILLPNSIDFAVAYFGSLRAGQVAVPLNTGYTAVELEHQLHDAGVTVLISTTELSARIEPAGQQRVMLVDGPDWVDGSVDDAVSGQSSAGGDDLAVLLYTSGTSGRPRGAMLSHRALLGNLDQVSQIVPPVVANDDIVLLVLPLFHVYGLNSGLGLVAKAGATGVLADRFDPVETLTLIRKQHVSNIVGAPPMYVAWSMLPDLGESMETVRLAVSGAAPLPPVVLSSVLETTGHHVFEGYGLTETSPVLTTTLCSEVAKPGSVGRAIPGVELEIRDSLGRIVDEDDTGEVVVRGKNLFSGYWPHGAGGPDPSGWFRTGDIGYLDSEGDLHLVDRARELILVSGFNVYPREVEAVLEEHPSVGEVAVIGVPHPYTGETVKAIVVPRPDATVEPDELIAFAAERLARFKCPTAVEIVSQLPHSLTGKVAKGQLRERRD